MNSKMMLLALAVMAISCNDAKKDNAEAIKALNEQSLKCISIMNQADAQKNAAMATGDAGAIAALQKTIDSAAKENVKIGQQIIELQNK